MSTITKQWLQQKIADMEAARDEIPFGLDEDDSNTLAAMRIALASLEAEAAYFINRVKHSDAYGEDVELRTYCYELDALKSKDDFGGEIVPVYTVPPAPANAEPVALLWSHRKHPSEVTLVRPEDDDRAEGAHWSGWSCQALYAVPPETVSVPAGYRLQPISEYDAMCAAMLQGAEPVSNRDELRVKVRREHAEWSQATFGDVGPVGPLKHLSKEALEAAAEPGDLSEWADMQFLLWDAQRRAGISDGEITAAMEEKLKVNIARQWPEPKDGEPRLHIKAAPQQEVKQ